MTTRTPNLITNCNITNTECYPRCPRTARERGTLTLGYESPDRLDRSEAGDGPVDGFRCDQRGADIELQVLAGAERRVARVAGEQAAVHDHGHLSAGRANLVRSEGLVPLVEEITERIGPLHRRLDVDDPVRGVGVQPVEAPP